MRFTNSMPTGKTITPGTSISGIGSTLLLVFFFAPWFTACNVDVSGMDLATQQSLDGESAWWLLGIPIVSFLGIMIALTVLNKSLAVVGRRAWGTLLLALYPLLCVGILYLNLKAPQEGVILDVRPLIQIKFGFWGTLLASLAMMTGAVLDIAAAKGQPRASAAAPVSQPAFHPRPPPGQVSAWLEGQSGEWAQQRLNIMADEFVIGRHHSSHLRLAEKAVSRRHAVIRSGHGRYFIQDQNSALGTYVNGQRMAACELKPGDVIRIGQTEFRFRGSR